MARRAARADRPRRSTIAALLAGAGAAVAAAQGMESVAQTGTVAESGTGTTPSSGDDSGIDFGLVLLYVLGAILLAAVATTLVGRRKRKKAVPAKRQVEREGQRVELPLAFPHPRSLPRAVIIPAVSVRSPIEGVGIGIDQNHPPVTPEQAGGHPSQFWVTRSEAKQRGQLQTGIPQPHGGDVAGDHPGFFAILAQIDRGGGDVGQ